MVRWVDRLGRAYRLHRTQKLWIPEGRLWELPKPMPFFHSAFEARAAILDAPGPPGA